MLWYLCVSARAQKVRWGHKTSGHQGRWELFFVLVCASYIFFYSKLAVIKKQTPEYPRPIIEDIFYLQHGLLNEWGNVDGRLL